MAFVSEKKLGEIRDRLRIEDVARDYHLVLQPVGSRLRALCPFHREKTPSFYINTELQYFKCFGCGAGGDVFTFVRRMDQVSFPEAVEILARKGGVVLEYDRSDQRARSRSEKAAIAEALGLAEQFYHHLLVEEPQGEPARRYLDSRSIGRESWTRFRLGYSPSEWRVFSELAQRKGFSAEVLEKAGLVRHRQESASRPGQDVSPYYDTFRGRLMFPIADGMKRVVGFGARALGDDQPKYMNTPKTAVFDKSQVLYGLPQARKAIEEEKTVAVVEGYTDVIVAHQEGLRHFVGSLGTAFTVQNARQLRRMAPRVQLVFDGDLAGQSAAERSLELLVAEEIDVRVYTVVDGKDPCEALLALGGPGFRQRVEEDSEGLFEFKWRRTVGALPPSERDAAATARALDEVLDLLLKVPNNVTRQLYVRDFAEALNLPQEELLKRLRARATASAPRSSRALAPIPTDPARVGRSQDGKQNGKVERVSVAKRELNGRAKIDNPSLEEVVIECLLADPAKASRRWQELPKGFFEECCFEEPHMKCVAAEIERELYRYDSPQEGDAPGGRAHGPIDSQSLLRALVAEPEAVESVVRILERIGAGRYDHAESRTNEETERQLDREEKGFVPLNVDEKWDRCLRDIKRHALDRRRKELESRKARAREEGDAAGVLAAEREYIEVLRQRALSISQ